MTVYSIILFIIITFKIYIGDNCLISCLNRSMPPHIYESYGVPRSHRWAPDSFSSDIMMMTSVYEVFLGEHLQLTAVISLDRYSCWFQPQEQVLMSWVFCKNRNYSRMKFYDLFFSAVLLARLEDSLEIKILPQPQVTILPSLNSLI